MHEKILNSFLKFVIVSLHIGCAIVYGPLWGRRGALANLNYGDMKSFDGGPRYQSDSCADPGATGPWQAPKGSEKINWLI